MGPFGRLYSSFKSSMARSIKIDPAVFGIKRGQPSASSNRILEFSDKELAVILRALPPLEKVRMRLVCRHWSELFEQSQMWQFLDLKSLFRILHSNRLLIFSELAKESLCKIDLSGCWQVEDEAIEVLSVNCPNISILSISNCWKLTDRGLSYLAENLKYLKDLDMSYCGQLSCSSFPDHNWTLLQRVNLSYCRQIGDENLEALLGRTTDMHTLSLRRCSRVTDFGLFLVVRYCMKLRVLDLGECDQVTDKCLKWIASSCHELSCLSLSFCSKISNSGIYDLSLGFQAYSSLNLTHCTQITDASILFFSDSMKSLRQIHLRHCKKLTDATANYISEIAPRLKLLDLTACPNVSIAIKASIKARHPLIKVLVDSVKEDSLPRDSRKPRAKEIAPNKRYTSGPRDMMMGISKRATPSDSICVEITREGRTNIKVIPATSDAAVMEYWL